MIAVDSSTIISYINGIEGDDTQRLHTLLLTDQAAICPLVITEVVSSGIDLRTKRLLEEFRLLDFDEAFWFRAGALRQKILDQGLKSRLADAVIAQSAIDHDAFLLTRDKDFRHYARHGGLKLLIHQ
jgi:predicted nucleic acid-binding protein